MSLFSREQKFLVTGASSGIGRAIAISLALAGATVICNGRREEELTATCSFSSGSMFPEPLDLAASLENLSKWLSGLTEKYGALSGLANCAGITWNAPLSFYNISKAEQIFKICCHAPLILSGTFCRKKIHANKAAIVNIAAAAAVDPNPGQGIYAAAKAALVAGSKCLAREANGVRVNCVSPGLVETPMCEATIAQLGKSFMEREAAQYPLGFGKPEDVADLAIFLLSAKAQWITGQNFLITGGR